MDNSYLLLLNQVALITILEGLGVFSRDEFNVAKQAAHDEMNELRALDRLPERDLPEYVSTR